MTTLLVTPPADVAAILAGSQTVIAVRGEPCGPLPPWPDERLCPPAALVAATKDCGDCGGSGLVRWAGVAKNDVIRVRGEKCPDCNGRGTPPVELVTTCKRCEGSGWRGNSAVGCLHCERGSRVHGTVGISEVLRVEDADRPDMTYPDTSVCQVQLIDGEWTLWLWRKVDYLTNEWDQWSLTDQLRFLPPPTTLTSGGWFICLLNNPQGAT